MYSQTNHRSKKKSELNKWIIVKRFSFEIGSIAKVYPLFQLVFTAVLEILNSAVRQEKNIKMGKEERQKIYNVADYMYLKNPREHVDRSWALTNI